MICILHFLSTFRYVNKDEQGKKEKEKKKCLKGAYALDRPDTSKLFCYLKNKQKNPMFALHLQQLVSFVVICRFNHS